MTNSQQSNTESQSVARDVKISLTALRSLPSGILRFIRIHKVKDMGGVDRTAMVVMWSCREPGIRVSDFCVDTGEYLGEDIK